MTHQEDCFHLGIKTLLRNTEGKLLLLEKRSKNSVSYWDIPGGRINVGESINEAIQRELLEEIGLKEVIKVTPLITFPTNIRIQTPQQNVGLILSVYLGKIDQNFVPQLSSEHKSFSYFLLEEVIEQFKAQYPPVFLEALEKLKLREQPLFDSVS